MKLLGSLVTMAMVLTVMIPAEAFASSWDPTLLVNTESFQEIDEGDGTSDIFLQFGTSADQRLVFSNSENLFIFTDDVKVYGNIAASGSLSINTDGTGDAQIIFTNATGDQTVTFTDASQAFTFSTGATFNGTISGATLTVSDLQNCEIVVTDANGNLSCSTLGAAGVLTQAQADDRYVNTSGDTMTGDLLLINGAGVRAQGDFVTSGSLILNDDNTGDAILTFGNDAGAETLRFNDTVERFELSDDLAVTGNLSGQSLTIDSGNISINGVDYIFDNTDGNNGQVLTTDGAGNLTWETVDTTQPNGSGSMMSLSPQYTNAVYAEDGSDNTGRLQLLSDDTNDINYYRWFSTKNTLQDYDIVVRVRVPENFDSWQVSEAITLAYRTPTTTATDHRVTMEIYDTTGTSDYTSGNLASANTWTEDSATKADLNGTYTAGDYMEVRIKMFDRNAGTTSEGADVGYLNFNWATTTP